MKGLTLALLATLVGRAMLVTGDGGTASVLVTCPSGGLEEYRKWVVTEEAYSFDEQPAAASGRVLVQGPLAVS